MVGRRNHIHAFAHDMRKCVTETLNNRKFVYPIVRRLADLARSEPDEFMSGFITECQDRFEESIIRSTFSTPISSGVPRLRHRIWITDPDNPTFPTSSSIYWIVNEIRSQENTGWRNIFWTNSAPVQAAVAETFAAENVCVSFRSIDEFTHLPANSVLQTLISHDKFVLACAIARILVIRQNGGLYSDLGVHVRNEVLDAIEISDYAIMLGENCVFQSSLFAAAAGSKLTELMMGVVCNPEAVPADIVRTSDKFSPVDEVDLFAGPGLTVLLFNFLSRCDRLLILAADGKRISWNAERSWYGEAKFGNTDLSSSKVSVLDEDKYNAADAVRTEAVRTFGDVGLIGLKLQILVGLHSYFEQNPTRLCRILFHNGSDKALWWHNYGYFYFHLLHDFVAAGADLFEVGIGTNNLDVPSTMGVTGVPGASLRAWKEFFINGAVYGADVDRRILFRENDITTSFVDQTDPATIDAMWAGLDRKFEIIIDDGLHCFDANLSFYERSRAYAKQGGWFVVEDVRFHEIEAWAKYIESNKLDAVILKIPSARNKQDNNLVIFPIRR
jgi:hypothetical protein